MRAIDSKILVKEIKQEELQEKIGDLVVPVGSSKDKMTFEVISVGEKVESLKPGDKILTYYDPGHTFKQDNVEYRIISVPDILVVL